MRGAVQTQKQWIRNVFGINQLMAPPSPADVILGAAVFQDTVGGLTTMTRVLRVLATVNIFLEGWNITAAAVSGGLCPILSLGLVRCDPSLPNNSIGSLNANDADRAWLFRQDYRLPIDVSGSWSGTVNLNGEPYHLDWQLRGGRGTSLTKDVELRWVVEIPGRATGQLLMTVDALWLCE